MQTFQTKEAYRPVEVREAYRIASEEACELHKRMVDTLQSRVREILGVSELPTGIIHYVLLGFHKGSFSGEEVERVESYLETKYTKRKVEEVREVRHKLEESLEEAIKGVWEQYRLVVEKYGTGGISESFRC